MVSSVAWGLSFVIIFAAIVAFIIAGSGKAREKRRFDRGAPVLSARAKVVDERTAVAGSIGPYGGSTATQYFATFELPDGHRMEFVVGGEVAGQIVIGDTGVLYWQATSFKGFQREILR